MLRTTKKRTRIAKMINKPNRLMTDAEKQKAPLANEVAPQNAFSKLVAAAIRASNKFGLKTFKIDSIKKPE